MMLLAAAPQPVSSQVQPGGASIVQSPPRVTSQASGVGEMCMAGRIFGITNYQCTSCGVSMPRDSMHFVYSFGSEPIVIETDNPTNRIKPGDAVVAVNGSPITTRAGADQFAYPAAGNSTITVRKPNGTNITIEQSVSGRCPFNLRSSLAFSADTSSRNRRGGAGGFAGRVGGPTVRTDSTGLSTFDTTVARMSRPATPVSESIVAGVTIRNFGLALACRPICRSTRTRDGSVTYWQFDGFPAVNAPAQGSVAARSGLQDGDVIISVNGFSPLSEEGALILNRAERALTLRLEISRGGKRERITLKL
jgi:membrane-associated protease RseP (regulator of RpoE activity)